MKSEVFKMAWELVKEFGMTLSESLTKAWKAAKLKAQLLKGNVNFKFKKKDGSIREAVGTLANLNYESKGGKKNYKAIAYYDLVSQGFRSFSVNNLI